MIIAHEVFHALKLKKIDNKFDFPIKLDTTKAYDSVEQSFLESLMVNLGFLRLWIS